MLNLNRCPRFTISVRGRSSPTASVTGGKGLERNREHLGQAATPGFMGRRTIEKQKRRLCTGWQHSSLLTYRSLPTLILANCRKAHSKRAEEPARARGGLSNRSHLMTTNVSNRLSIFVLSHFNEFSGNRVSTFDLIFSRVQAAGSIRSFNSMEPNLPWPLSTIVAYIGIDWADRKHDIVVYDCASNTWQESIIETRPQDILDWVNQLRDRYGGKIAIATTLLALGMNWQQVDGVLAGIVSLLMWKNLGRSPHLP